MFFFFTYLFFFCCNTREIQPNCAAAQQSSERRKSRRRGGEGAGGAAAGVPRVEIARAGNTPENNIQSWLSISRQWLHQSTVSREPQNEDLTNGPKRAENVSFGRPIKSRERAAGGSSEEEAAAADN